MLHFQVDMGLVTAGFTTPEVNGTWNSWCGNCNPMTDADGDGVWEATIPLTIWKLRIQIFCRCMDYSRNERS